MTSIKSYRPDVDVPDQVAIAYQVIAGIAETFDRIVDLCAAAGTTPSYFYRTCATDKRVAENLTIARRIRAQRHADEAAAIAEPDRRDWGRDDYGRYTANTGLLKRAELRIRTHMQLAAKLDPDTYGDRQPVRDAQQGSAVQFVILPTEQAASAYRARMKLLTDGAEDAVPPPARTDPSGMEPAAPLTHHVALDSDDPTEK